jgi:DNA adenine methylase
MRYIGAKTDLLKEIDDFISEQQIKSEETLTFCDAFSGTGAVGEFFKDRYRITANDIQYYSYIMTQAKLNTPDFTFKKLGLDPFTYFNENKNEIEGFVFQQYSYGGSAGRMYFSAENGKRIDFIRQKIEQWFNEEKLTENEYHYLIAALIESVSRVANIAGVYGSYLKTWDPRAKKWMKFIKVEQSDKKALHEAEVHNRTIENLINDVSGDILYLDPPYTKNQYSVQYHLLETIAKYDDPDINGKGGLRNTTSTSSSFSRSGEVETVFEYIIAKAKFKYIILSYSSDGIMSKGYIENVLKRYGDELSYKLKKIKYKKYRNHQTTNDDEHCEYLFFIKKNLDEKIKFASPLNYQGGKYDLIDFIKDNLPVEKSKRFIDLFGGGYNVGVNINAEQNIYNEYNHKVVELMQCFKNTETADLVKYILRTKKRYGLEPANKEAYLKLRTKYNETDIAKRDPKMLYLLILYGFNQQIRFNSSYDYNNPVGPAGFNDSMMDKLISFCRRIQEQNLVLLSRDFEDLDEYITENSFVYCDPPYYITLGSYNDGKRGFSGWTKKDELRLYKMLERLNERNIKFMLSNVLDHKDKHNDLLEKWIKKNKFNIIQYTGKARKGRKEILITNYRKEME